MPSSLSSFQPPYNMTLAPFSYYTVAPNSPYSSSPNLADYSSSQGTTSNSCGNKYETIQGANPFFQSTEIQPGFMTHVQPHNIIHAAPRMPSLAMPFSADQSQRTLEGSDRLGWQLAYERYAQEHPQILPTQYLLGPQTGSSATSGLTFPVNHCHESPTEVYDQVDRDPSASSGDRSVSC